MTHITGPRSVVLDRGFNRVVAALDSLKRPAPTASEQQHILHDVERLLFFQVGGANAEAKVTRPQAKLVRALRAALKPIEDAGGCPTCPKSA